MADIVKVNKVDFDVTQGMDRLHSFDVSID